jgi:hypothetical protein
MDFSIFKIEMGRGYVFIDNILKWIYVFSNRLVNIKCFFILKTPENKHI